MQHENGNGIWGGIKGLFVEQSDDAASQAEAEQAPSISPPLTSVHPVSPVAPQPDADEGMVAELTKTVTNLRTAYSAFRESLVAMESVQGMDEATRYRAAFAMLKTTQGKKSENIGQALEVHVQALEGEVLRFRADSQKRTDATKDKAKEATAQVETRTNAAAARIEELKAEIAKLQQELDDGKQEVAAIEAQCAADISKIEDVSKRFETAAAVVSSRLTADRDKLSSYLK